jgi:NAD-dependent dihydropyrimidine dehydrogenase PreA subunit
MSVARTGLEKCIGCGQCVERCPMDVFYFDNETKKSVMVYPENCQSCGQCYLACPANCLIMVDTIYEYAPVPIRGLRTFPTGEKGEKNE